MSDDLSGIRQCLKPWVPSLSSLQKQALQEIKINHVICYSVMVQNAIKASQVSNNELAGYGGEMNGEQLRNFVQYNL